MPLRNIYIFLDEGGNFDFSPRGTKYFTCTTLTKRRPFNLHNQLAELKYDLLENGTDIEYFHAAEDKQAVRDQVFEIIGRNINGLKIDSFIVEKSKVDVSLQAVERFYPEILGRLLNNVLSDIDAASYDEVIVVTDTVPVKKHRKAVEKAAKLALSKNLPKTLRHRLIHHASKSNFGLQAADYCNWAILRKWERNDDRSYNLIRQAIRNEIDGL